MLPESPKIHLNRSRSYFTDVEKNAFCSLTPDFVARGSATLDRWVSVRLLAPRGLVLGRLLKMKRCRTKCDLSAHGIPVLTAESIYRFRDSETTPSLKFNRCLCFSISLKRFHHFNQMIKCFYAYLFLKATHACQCPVCWKFCSLVC